MFSLKIISCKGMISFQGAERRRAMEVGLTASGAVDPHALKLCNHLLGNAPLSTALEIWWGGLAVEVIGNGVIATAGADLNLKLNGKKQNPYNILSVRNQDHLEFTRPLKGQVAYLQIPGGFSIESESFCEKQSRLKIGQEYKVETLKNETTLSTTKINNNFKIQLVPHPKFMHIFPEWFEKLAKTPIKIQEISRMAMKLNSLIPITKSYEPISKPTPFGGLQISSNGTAFILLSERQSIGGYPVLGLIPQESIHALLNLDQNKDFYFEVLALNS